MSTHLMERLVFWLSLFVLSFVVGGVVGCTLGVIRYFWIIHFGGAS